MEESDRITFYYYTAWDGFAWQGCDESTANSLQGYMEATRTLPKSSADQPPFGGAVPCKIKGQTGVAVYRYHVRLKGDLSNRDSLYIALAFVPLDVGCVDFAKLLALPQLAETKPGKLEPDDSKTARDLGICLDGAAGEMDFAWQDKGIEERYQSLHGRSGLLTLSHLFFSTRTQLGFLNSVFKSEEGIDKITANQTYKVYKEVERVVSARGELESAKMRHGGVLPQDDPAVAQMKSALADLNEWATRQRGYPGLGEYYDENLKILEDEEGRLRRIREYTKELQELLKRIPSVEKLQDGRQSHVGRASSLPSDVDSSIAKCKDLVKKLDALPVIDHEEFKNAVRLSVDAARRAEYVLGLKECASVESKLEEERNRSDGFAAKVKDRERQIADLNKRLDKYEHRRRSRRGDVGDDKPGPCGYGVTSRDGSSGTRSSWGILDCAMAAIIAVSVAVLGYVAYKTWTGKPLVVDSASGPAGTPEGGSGPTNTTSSVQADAETETNKVDSASTADRGSATVATPLAENEGAKPDIAGKPSGDASRDDKNEGDAKKGESDKGDVGRKGADDRKPDNKAANEKKPDNKAANGKKPDNKAADAKGKDGKESVKGNEDKKGAEAKKGEPAGEKGDGR